MKVHFEPTSPPIPISDQRRSVTLLKNNGCYRIQLIDSFIPEILDTFEELLKELFTPVSECIRWE